MFKNCIRLYSKKNYLVGRYKDGSFTPLGQKILPKNFLNEENWDKGKVRIIYENEKKIALVGVDTFDEKLKKQFSKQNENYFDSLNISKSITSGVKSLMSDDEKLESVTVDNFGNPKMESYAAELASFKFPKIGKKRKTISFEFESKSQDIAYGKILAESQIMASFLATTPANYMTPTIFCEEISSKCDNSKVYDKEWAKEMKMNSFLSVAKGSAEEPKIIESRHMGRDSKEIDLILVGKGITFDAGGISLKPAPGMKDMKGDMAGAAAVMSAFYGISKLNLPLNVVAISFLCENMPSSRAVKPGDVVTAMNGKTIEVDNTDAEGRLILADALSYASTMKPKVIVDVATLTGAAVVALGSPVNAVFSRNNELWEMIEKAGCISKDLMWRLPLFASYLEGMKSTVADWNNISDLKEAGSGVGAIFLNEFVDEKVLNYAHLDVAATAMGKKEMTGRPTTALIELANLLSQNLEQLPKN
jgi:cytosol aminopeptidase